MKSPFNIFRRLMGAFDALERIDRRLEGIHALLSHTHHTTALETHSRYADPRHLARHGLKCFSQHDEDGIIAEIFRRIGVTNRTFVEFGVGPANENNTLLLLVQGWNGVWIEKQERSVARIRERCAIPLREGRLKLVEAFITAETIEELFTQAGVPEALDLLSIDIDGNDYWVWNAIRRFRPRVVVIEYRTHLGPTTDAVMRYNPKWVWGHGHKNFGASLKALERLGREKGYALVACDFAGTNAFFVQQELVTDTQFLPPYTSEQHFEPKKRMFFTPKRPANQDDASSFFREND